MAITYATDENYKELVSGDYALVDFYGDNCIPCRMLARVLEDIEEELPFVNIIKVDTGKCPKLCEEFNIVGIPDVYYYKNGEIVCHQTGAADGDEIREMLAKIMY